MSITQQIQTIKRGLFTDEYSPLEMRQILDNGTQSVIHWGRIRPAVMALGEMPWYELDANWQFFLNEERYPIGRTMDLRPDEVGTFQSLVRNLVNATREPMRILTSVHPEEFSYYDVSVVIDSTELEVLEKAIYHVRHTAELAAIDDAVTVSSLQPGSLEIVLTAGKVTMMAINLMILLARALKNPQIHDDVRRLVKLQKLTGNDADEDAALATVIEDTQESFWESATELLENVTRENNVNFPEAKNKINLAAKEIYENAAGLSANWKLPPAVIDGFPNGLNATLYGSPEEIGRVLKELAAPPSAQDDTSTDC